MKIYRALLLILLLSASAAAGVKLPAVFGNAMVLQRSKPVPVWGTASKNEPVSVTLRSQAANEAAPAARGNKNTQRSAGAHAVTTADSLGRWMLTLPAMQAGGPYTLTVSAGADSVTFTNVMVGEVWLCSGQSNMEFALKKTDHAEEDIRSAALPMIRLFTVKHKIAQMPQPDVAGGAWQECSPQSAENFSAVAFFFAREMQPRLKCAIGLIHSAWGGTPAEAWTPDSTLKAGAEFASILETWQRYYEAYPEAQKKYDAVKDSLLKQYDADVIKARAERTPLPRRPVEPRGPGHRDSPSGAYNGMIHPLAPFALGGVLWYQGEANATRAIQYRTLFPAMIRSWRMLFQQPDLPFLFVQLPNLIRKSAKDKEGWTLLREAQSMTLSLPRTGMAVTIDLGDSLDIHPTNKREVGRRLSLVARALVFGDKNVEYSGPVYQRTTREGASMRVRFTHATGGLAGGADVRGFTIAGEDSIFHPAHARIEGGSVVVWSEQVAKPIAVRYGWMDNPTCTLANKAGLPASPFRTDAFHSSLETLPAQE